MKTEKPIQLVALLTQLLSETDKMNIGKIYIAIIEETKRITFVTLQNSPFTDLIFKHLIQLSIKDFIHSGRSEASSKVVSDVIDVISNSEMTA
jgi:hypothetical protein